MTEQDTRVDDTKIESGVAPKQTFARRIGIVAFLVLVLLIPLWLVQDVVDGREKRFNEVRREIGANWGPEQEIAPPVLIVPVYRVIVESGKSRRDESFVMIEPRKVDVTGHLDAKRLARGIFSAIAYSAQISAQATFSKKDIQSKLTDGFKFDWQRAYFGSSALDARKVDMAEPIAPIPQDKDQAEYAVQNRFGKTLNFIGIRLDDQSIKKFTDVSSDDEVMQQTQFTLRGSTAIRINPGRYAAVIHLSGNWSSPVFEGSQLPDDRDVTAVGFNATWMLRTNAVNNPPVNLEGFEVGNIESNSSDRGFHVAVRLNEPTSVYRKITRVADYGVLIVILTYTAFVLFELIGGSVVHPVQYLLMGGAMCIFYLLLLSTSEILGFGPAYFASTFAVVAQMSLYTWSITGRRQAAVIASLVTVLYGLMYLLIGQENYPLLIGSWALFIALSAVMWLTRRINWSATVRV